MSKRFDNRTKDTFKKDIKFGTMMESYWWGRWVEDAMHRADLDIANPRDNGCGNDGEFIESGNTAGADFKADVRYDDEPWGNLPIELKWVPTAGKFTLKENDLKAYVRERAAILFVYNDVACGTDLRKPKDYDFDKHIRLIESKMDQIKWGLMFPDKLKEFYDYCKQHNLFEPVRYMGNKSAVILRSRDFDKWFKQDEFYAAS